MSTKIDWADETLNPQGWGCFGPGGTHDNPQPCSYCYAKRMASRMMRTCELCNQFIPHYHPEVMEMPYRWKKPRKIFWQSMGDLFHPHTPDWLIQGVLAVVEANPRHTNIFLTKNPKRLQEFNPWPPNCWVGTTVTNQADADERIPWLLQVDAVVRFVSHEPLLSKIYLAKSIPCSDCDGSGYLGVCRNGKKQSCERCGGDEDSLGHGIEPGISWAIIGAMTGPGAVKPEPEWITSLVGQYRAAGVPVFLKDNLHGLVGLPWKSPGRLLHADQPWPQEFPSA